METTETYARLEQAVTELVREAQIKMGYQEEAFHLYYPLSALNKLLGTDCDLPQMTRTLQDFAAFAQPRLGKLDIAARDGRFCLTIPAEGMRYVHEHLDENDFLVQFISVIGRHGATLEEVLAVFYAHSDRVVVRKMEIDDFDYLVYFEDGVPNDYRYCLTVEDCHIIYHRFTREDYEGFGYPS
ncbi:MAG: DUF3877 family protein [Clostridiales bacterium]|nr:DUF3877 family protein [Clostridiales bacterium]